MKIADYEAKVRQLKYNTPTSSKVNLHGSTQCLIDHKCKGPGCEKLRRASSVLPINVECVLSTYVS